jgi:hypothetical protein
MAERRGSRLDTPKEQRRTLIRTPSYDRDAFGVFAEQFARYMGTAKFLLWMTVFVVGWIGWNALAQIRQAELPVSLAAMVYVCRQPLETPTGRLLGVAHFQRLLREPPSTLVAAALDQSMDPLHPEATIDEVAAHLATYNLVAAPVVDEDGHLLGAVTVDDLLDHMLPENWRDHTLTTSRSPEVSHG